eukprot:scaffold625_cov324-Pavlova_lutheri.AAC.2
MTPHTSNCSRAHPISFNKGVACEKAKVQSMRLREHAPEAPTMWKMYQSTAKLSFLAQGFAYTLQLDMDKVKRPSQRHAHAT